MCEQRGAHPSHEVPFDSMRRRTLLRWRLGVTAGSSLGRAPGGELDDGHPFTARAESEATPGLDIDPIEHLQQMKKVLMDNDNFFGANSVILSVREQVGNLQQLRQSYRGASRKKLLQVQTRFGDLCGDAAEAALRLAPQDAGRIRAVAMTYAAHGHALRRDATNCERSYAAAQDLTGRLKPDPISPWALFFNHSYIEVRRARSLTLFGEYWSAVESFNKAITRLPRGYRRGRGVYLARQAVAHLGNNDVEQACEVGLRALILGVETGSLRIIEELERLNSALRKSSTTSQSRRIPRDHERGFLPLEVCG